jgi:hypothetical protein
MKLKVQGKSTIQLLELQARKGKLKGKTEGQGGKSDNNNDDDNNDDNNETTLLVLDRDVVGGLSYLFGGEERVQRDGDEGRDGVDGDGESGGSRSAQGKCVLLDEEQAGVVNYSCYSR